MNIRLIDNNPSASVIQPADFSVDQSARFVALDLLGLLLLDLAPTHNSAKTHARQTKKTCRAEPQRKFRCGGLRQLRKIASPRGAVDVEHAREIVAVPQSPSVPPTLRHALWIRSRSRRGRARVLSGAGKAQAVALFVAPANRRVTGTCAPRRRSHLPSGVVRQIFWKMTRPRLDRIARIQAPATSPPRNIFLSTTSIRRAPG